MKRTLVIFSLFICLNKTNAQTNTTGTTTTNTSSSNAATAPDEANTDFRNKFQDTSKQTQKNRKSSANSNTSTTGSDEANTDFQHKFQDSSKAGSKQGKHMNHGSMGHSSDSSNMRRKTSGNSSNATKPNE